MLHTKKIILCFGTRPEAIKMAPLIVLLRQRGYNIKICVTAQHRHLLDQVLGFFDIKPDFDLNLMTPNQNLNELSARLFSGINQVYKEFQPDLVVVHGDTTTSMICALAAFHLHIKVAHLEAGLRTYNFQAPFPEEMNRQLTGRIADFHLSPTLQAKNNLLKEGVNASQIAMIGNTVIDALYLTIEKLSKGYQDSEIETLQQIIDPRKRLVLITGHRRENFGDGFLEICKAIKELAKSQDIQFIYPVHLNPNVQKPVNDILGDLNNVHLWSPIGYPAFVWLMQQSYFIITDSGGVQEEAPALGKPLVVLRETSERPEVVEAGIAKLVGSNKNKIIDEVTALLIDESYYQSRAIVFCPYGEGNAATSAIDFLETVF